MGVSKTSDHIQIKIKIPNPSQEHLESSKDMIMGQSNTSEHIQIKMKMSTPNLRQTTYLIKAGLLWANLRQTKYIIKAELLWADPILAELPDLRLICAELSLFFYT